MGNALVALFVLSAISIVSCRLTFFDFLRNNGLSYNPVNQTRFISVSDVVNFYKESGSVSVSQKKAMKRFETWETCNLAFFPLALLVAILAIVFS